MGATNNFRSHMPHMIISIMTIGKNRIAFFINMKMKMTTTMTGMILIMNIFKMT